VILAVSKNAPEGIVVVNDHRDHLLVLKIGAAYITVLSYHLTIMGQRHQAFAIARIVLRGRTEPQYRCIAAFHHQWCYGKLPLKATRRFLTLIKQKSNAEIIRAEIQSIDGKYGALGEKPDIPAVPCPYTALLLATCWSIDLKEDPVYISGVSFTNDILDARMNSGDGRK
jgi:hypothetical protein